MLETDLGGSTLLSTVGICYHPIVNGSGGGNDSVCNFGYVQLSSCHQVGTEHGCITKYIELHRRHLESRTKYQYNIQPERFADPQRAPRQHERTRQTGHLHENRGENTLT